MAALHSYGIDNLLIDIDSSEMPILDGSSIEFTNAFSKIGLKELKAKKRYLKTYFFKNRFFRVLRLVLTTLVHLIQSVMID